jgi:ABC-type iron transport system FetAB permease component
MNKQTLHILHVYFSQVWELSSIIYSLLFLFYILFIVSTQIAASRRKNLKSDVWTLWLDIAIWSLSQKVKFDFSILPIDVICFMGTFLN